VPPPLPVGLIGEFLAERRPVIRTLGLLAVSQPGRALGHERQAAPEPSPAGTHRGRIPIGLGQQATAAQDRDLMGVDRIVFGFAAMDSLHVESLAQDQGKALMGAEVGEPVPGEETFNDDDTILPRGRQTLEKCLRAGFHLARDHAIAVLVEEAHIHGAGVQVEAAGPFGLPGGESREVSSA
jgi:hypothetical protein